MFEDSQMVGTISWRVYVYRVFYQTCLLFRNEIASAFEQIQSRCLFCGHQTVAPLAVYDTGKSVRRSVGWSSDYGCIGHVYDACTAGRGCHLVAQEQEGTEEPSDSKYQQKLPLICL